MSLEVGVGKTVELACATSGLSDGTAAEFEVVKEADGSPVAALSGKVTDGRARTDWVAEGPGPDDPEQAWRLLYTVRAAGLETKAKTLVVFCDWVEVASEDEDGNPLPDAAFRVTCGGATRERNTGSEAKWREEHLPRGEPRIEWLAPFELVEWLDADGPKRRAKLKKVLPAVLVWPPAGEHEQLVNLEPDPDAPERGSRITVKVKLEDGKAGDAVYAKLSYPDDDSARSEPAPGIEGGLEADWCPEGGVEAEMAADDGQDGCAATFELELGLAGGDRVTVAVGGTEACADEEVTITNWRQLSYQLTRGPDAAPPDLGAAEAALADVFVRYERAGEVVVDPDAAPPGAFVPAADLGRGDGRLLVVGDHDRGWLEGRFAPERSPVQAHLILADACYDGGSPAHEQTLEDLARSPELELELQDPDVYDVFSVSLADGQSSVRPGSRWGSGAPAGHPDAGAAGELTGGAVVWGGPGAPDRLRVVLPPEAAAIVGAGEAPEGGDPRDPAVRHPVRVTLVLHVARGPFLGEASGLRHVVARAPTDARLSELVCHALGHAVGLLSRTPPGLSPADHGRDYAGKGHGPGDHCADGLSEAAVAEPELEPGRGTCVMYGARPLDATPPTGRFCARCRPFFRALDCRSLEA